MNCYLEALINLERSYEIYRRYLKCHSIGTQVRDQRVSEHNVFVCAVDFKAGLVIQSKQINSDEKLIIKQASTLQAGVARFDIYSTNQGFLFHS